MAGEQIKLLEENVVSGRIEGHVLLHRYSPNIREISMVDIIAGERGGAVKRLPPRLTADGNADRTRVFDGFAPKRITVPYFTP